MKRSKNPEVPAHHSPSPPVPESQPLKDSVPPIGEEEKLDPTRYGDWEKKGIAVDF